MEISQTTASIYIEKIGKTLSRFYIHYILNIINKCSVVESDNETENFRTNLTIFVNKIKKDITDEHKIFLAMIPKPAFVSDCIENINKLYMIMFPDVATNETIQFESIKSDELLFSIIVQTCTTLWHSAFLVKSKGYDENTILINKNEIIKIISSSIINGIDECFVNSFIINNRNNRLSMLKEITIGDDQRIKVSEQELNELIRKSTTNLKIKDNQTEIRQRSSDINNDGSSEVNMRGFGYNNQQNNRYGYFNRFNKYNKYKQPYNNNINPQYPQQPQPYYNPNNNPQQPQLNNNPQQQYPNNPSNGIVKQQQQQKNNNDDEEDDDEEDDKDENKESSYNPFE